MTDTDTYLDRRTLANLGYLNPQFLSRDHWAAVIQTGSFAAIVDGNRDALACGYLNRWNYQTLAGAGKALRLWDGEGEPDGYISKFLSDDLTVWP